MGLCLVCKKKFIPLPNEKSQQKFCSKFCGVKFNREKFKLNGKQKLYDAKRQKNPLRILKQREYSKNYMAKKTKEERHMEYRKYYLKHKEIFYKSAYLRRYKLRGTIGHHTKKQWEKLKKKYNYCCAICGMQEPFIDQWYQWLTEDHIIPISRKGTNWINNIQPLCFSCNSKKRDK